MSRIIALHMGQCGVQIGSAVWELLCLEHGIGPDGEVITEVQNQIIDSFFQEANDHKYSPRSLFIDTDATVIDEVRLGAYRNLYHPDYLMSGSEDASNNFARGSFYVGTEMLKVFRNRLNKMVEQLDSVESIVLFNSTGGGTGAGTGALFLQQIMLDFPKVVRIQFPVLPGAQNNSSVVEPYNVVFHMHTTMETVDLSALFDNEALYDMCSKMLLVVHPTFTNINRLIAMMVSSVTCSMRFESALNTSLQEIHTNLIPYPRIHFPFVRHAPIESQSRTVYNSRSVDDITKAVFRQENQSVKCDTNRGQYISIILNYRGDVSPREMTEAIQKNKSRIKFVEWSPTGFKMGLNYQTLMSVPDTEIAPCDKAVTMIANSTAIRETYQNIGRKFDLLFERRAFIHWYINEGMEESEFGESRYDLQLLQEDYEEIGFTEEEIIQILQANPEKNKRSISVRHEDDDEAKKKQQAGGADNDYGDFAEDGSINANAEDTDADQRIDEEVGADGAEGPDHHKHHKHHKKHHKKKHH